MISCIKNNPIKSVLATSLIVILWLSYSGFCFKQFRYIPDDEKVRIAIEYMLKQNKEEVAKSKGRYDLYPFKNVHEFLANAPISCEPSNDLRGGLDWVDKVIGRLSTYVFLEFKVNHDGTSYKEMRTISVTNCGNAWDPDDWY